MGARHNVDESVTLIIGIPTATPQTAPVYVGLGFVAIGFILLWYRRDLYWTYQWIVRYPDHGFVYSLVHFVGPIVFVVVGMVLVVTPFVGW